jgi:hypothetical protein
MKTIARVVATFVIVSFTQIAARAAEPSVTATRDAKQLAECMKSFDAECAAKMTYTKFMEERGMPRTQIVKGVADLYANLKSVNMRYSRFDFGRPSPSFSSDGQTYIFVPYTLVMEAPGRGGTMQEAYFIGVSENQGVTWAFVEGARANPQSIRAVIPSYKGQPSLPPVSSKQIAPSPLAP